MCYNIHKRKHMRFSEIQFPLFVQKPENRWQKKKNEHDKAYVSLNASDSRNSPRTTWLSQVKSVVDLLSAPLQNPFFFKKN